MSKKKVKDYYGILNISHNATEQEIKSAYRTLARKYHPDVNQGNKEYEQKFKEITEAYSILCDEKQRYLVDLALGHRNINTDKHQTSRPYKPDNKRTETSKHAKTNNKTAKTTAKPKDSNFSDTFSSLFENILKNVETSSSNKKAQNIKFTTEPPPVDIDNKSKKTETDKKIKPNDKSIRAEDITLDIYLPVDQAVKGTIKTLNILHTVPCEKCLAHGVVAGATCKICEGKGEKSTHKKLKVMIPSGIKNGFKLKIAGEGNKASSGGKDGDLYLIVKVYNPDNFEFEGNDVFTEIPILPHEAILGTEMQVLSIEGFVKMKIPPLTQSGQKFRLVNQGLPDPYGKRGNHFVKVKIEIPTEISPQEKELYTQISRLSRFNPRDYIE